jgi:hypothetical protein
MLNNRSRIERALATGHLSGGMRRYSGELTERPSDAASAQHIVQGTELEAIETARLAPGR